MLNKMRESIAQSPLTKIKKWVYLIEEYYTIIYHEKFHEMLDAMCMVAECYLATSAFQPLLTV